MNCIDPRAYAAKNRSQRDQDNPSFHEAMHGEYSADFQRAIVTEVKELMRQKTCKGVNRSDAPLDDAVNKQMVLKGT